GPRGVAVPGSPGAREGRRGHRPRASVRRAGDRGPIIAVMARDTPSPAASVLPPGVAPSFLSIHAVRVFVRDIDRSLRFYLDQLGFRLVIDTRIQSGERWGAVSPPGGNTTLAPVRPRSRTPPHRPTG